MGGSEDDTGGTADRRVPPSAATSGMDRRMAIRVVGSVALAGSATSAGLVAKLAFDDRAHADGDRRTGRSTDDEEVADPTTGEPHSDSRAWPPPPEDVALFAPLAAGDRLAEWTVEYTGVRAGAGIVVLADAGGARLQLDVCARAEKPAETRAPAHTEHFEIYVSNQGRGRDATDEEHGQAAFALARVIRCNEDRTPRGEFVTLAEHTRAAEDEILRVI